MVRKRSVPVTIGCGLWRSACSSCGDREVNMCAVPEGMTSADVIVWGEGGTFAQQIAAGRHRLKGDEPDSAGGTDTGPSPYDFLLAALGSCTSMTVIALVPPFKVENRARDLYVSAYTVGTMSAGPSGPTA